MNTTVYLIRHSIRFNNNYIEEYNTLQNKTIKNEKTVLSVEGEKRAEILSNEEELQNLDVIYASNCVRTLQTAKYIIEKQNLKVNIDDRFDERKVGKPNDDVIKDWFVRQYMDENYKTEGGESQKEVRARFSEAFEEAIDKNKVIYNKKINAPEVFKLEFDENNQLIDIQNTEFNDLPYKDGMGK